LWSEIRYPLDRYGTRAVKADTFPRYFTKAAGMGLFISSIMQGYARVTPATDIGTGGSV
jgi:hypothetical protein